MKGWKTIIVAAVIAALGAAEALDWTAIIPAGKVWSGLALASVGVLFGWLRTVTNTALGEKS